MRGFAGTMPRGVSPARGAQHIIDDMKNKAAAATGFPQVQTFRDSIVSKASTAVDKASSVVGAASDVAKQGVAISKQAIDSAKERLDAANDIATVIARQGMGSARERLDAARHGTWSVAVHGSSEKSGPRSERVQQLVDTDSQVDDKDPPATAAILCEQASLLADSPAKRVATKAMLKGERVKTSLKLAQASTLDVKRRAEEFVKRTFSKEKMTPKVSNENSNPLEEFSDSRVEPSDEECQEDNDDNSAQCDSDNSDSACHEARASPWSLRPSAGTWLLHLPYPDEPSVAEVSSGTSATPIVPLTTAEDEAQIEQTDAVSTKLRQMEQTSGAKAMPIRGGA